MRDHGASLTTSRADLSIRTPSSRGCRSLPCTVHSMNATCTTISGRTQCARTRGRPTALVNGGFGNLERVEARAQVEQQPGVEARAHLAREHEVAAVEVADEQRAESDAPALRIGEAADHQLLRRLALHLQPVRRAPMLVGRVAPLGDDALPAFPARALPGPLVVQGLDPAQRRPEGQLRQERAPLVEREAGHVAAVEPEDVEDVVGDLGRAPVRRGSSAEPGAGDLTVQDGVADRQRRHGAGDGRIRDVLRQPVARQEADVRPVLEGEQADAVELALEDPPETGEPLLSEGRGHRLQPRGRGTAHLGHHGPDRCKGGTRASGRQLSSRVGRCLGSTLPALRRSTCPAPP